MLRHFAVAYVPGWRSKNKARHPPMKGGQQPDGEPHPKTILEPPREYAKILAVRAKHNRKRPTHARNAIRRSPTSPILTQDQTVNASKALQRTASYGN